MRHAGRIAAGGAGDDLRPQPLGPDGQLLDRRGAEGVGGPQHDLLALALEHAASLAIDVVLPAPFTPATMITVGPLGA